MSSSPGFTKNTGYGIKEYRTEEMIIKEGIIKRSIRLICVSVLVMMVAFGLYSKQQDLKQKLRERDRDRWMWQLPRQVMDKIGVQPGMVVADVGAGDGYFSVYLAKRVGKTGRVFANDIDEKALGILRERCQWEKIKNISIIKGKPDDPLLPEGAVDLALLVNVIQQIENPSVFFNNLKKSLKPGGVIVFIQWDADKMAAEHPGLDSDFRAEFSRQNTLMMIDKAGLDVISTETFLPVQNIYICKPR